MILIQKSIGSATNFAMQNATRGWRFSFAAAGAGLRNPLKDQPEREQYDDRHTQQPTQKVFTHDLLHSFS
jgi:hypothetical protein